MGDFRDIYYSYQTQARGLLDEPSLRYQFNKMAKWYKSRLCRFLPGDKNACCLDIPCGYGNFLYFLEGQGYRNIIGLDLDPEQVKLARILGLNANEADAFIHLEESAESYDMISSLDFIEHLSKDKALEFVHLCMERLKPGGVLILRAPCADGPFGAHDAWNDMTHEWGMTSNVLRTILAIYGFERIETLDERPQPTNLVNLIRWLVYFPAKAVASGMCMALGIRPPTIWTRSMLAVAYKPLSSDA